MNRRTWAFVVGGLVVALILSFFVSRYASSQPDGLEKVAADKEIDTEERDHALAEGPFADYETTGIDDPGLATGVAGIVGVAITFVVAGGVIWLATRRRDRTSVASAPPATG
jgi:hypothetical protein